MPRPKGKKYKRTTVHLLPETIEYIRETACLHDYSSPSHFLRVLTIAAIKEIQSRNRLWWIRDKDPSEKIGKTYRNMDNYLRPEDIEFIETKHMVYGYMDQTEFSRSLIETAVKDFKTENRLELRKPAVQHG